MAHNQQVRPKQVSEADNAQRFLPAPPTEKRIQIALLIVEILVLLKGALDWAASGFSGLFGPLGVLMTLFVWSACLRLVSARKPSTVEEGAVVPAYNSRILRRVAWTMLVALPLGLPLGLLWFYVAARIPTKDFTVLVANLDGPDPQQYRATDILLTELHNAIDHTHKARIVPLGQTITEQQGSEEAGKQGQKHRAGIVLWGWYTASANTTLVTIHAEFLQASELVGLERASESVEAVADVRPTLDRFKAQYTLGRDMGCLALSIIGAVDFERGELAESIKYLTDAITGHGCTTRVVTDENLHLLRGAAYHYSGDSDNAFTDYEYAIALDQTLTAALNNRGLVFLERGQWNEALEDFSRVIEARDSCCRSAAYSNRCLLHFYMKQFEPAVDDCSQAIKLQPDLICAYDIRGQVYGKLSQNDSALDDFRKAIELDANYAPPYSNRGIVYADNLKDFDRAIRDFNEALKRRPKYKEAYNNRGLTYVYKGNILRGISDLQEAIKLDDAYLEAHENLGTAYLLLPVPDGKAAVTELRRASQLTTDKAKRELLLQAVATIDAQMRKSNPAK